MVGLLIVGLLLFLFVRWLHGDVDAGCILWGGLVALAIIGVALTGLLG